MLNWYNRIKCGVSKKACLSAALDLYDNSIVSYEIGLGNNNALAFKTLDKSIEFNPDAMPLFHIYRGLENFCRILSQKDIT